MERALQRFAITGGIGSGKSYVCHLLEARGISVYDCDEAAKRLMRSDESLQMMLQHLIGDEICQNGIIEKRVLAAFLLENDTHKQAVNDIVHPAVANDFMLSNLQWLESAILFESGFNHRVKFNHVVCVSAPLEMRVRRIMERDSITRESALQWIDRQMPQEEIEKRADFVIVNDGRASLETQIDKMFVDFNWEI
ncbi:dephospho-CoA kinase [Prevotella sp. HMSC077E09]|uniref:dephospho-CoA kinase n=1 Tax=Prevotella sp. HMSC077E09 TaxID=1739487 RepID=UPI0008A63EDE|nr:MULTISPECIES: dephospho-CoA kinase [unclassified Prevotella]OFO75974.1 dephospho-CoA kinase [Prevotella sp. HMSC077E08]OFP48894.1 dephospho-CoA kinase [Prevotella sp. HMSC077E09]